jgi:WD40 repeat protein
MGEDALDALLKGKVGGRRSRLPGLKVADILTMPPEHQSLVNWLLRHYEGQPETIAANLQQDLEQVQAHIQELISQGLLKTVEKNGSTYYRVKLAPKSGRQMPKDVWQVLDNTTRQANVFISYSRRNKEFVQELHGALEATGREVWVDWENIPVAVDWWHEIQLGIELADTFVFVLSPDSVASKVCGQEIEEALKHNKRLVPVICQDVQPDLVHPELARLNWIFLRSQDDFEKGFKGLLEALDQDLDYVRTHTRILVRALEWDRNGRDTSYLLRGADLDRANRYLAQGKDQEPRPTALHHQYVLASAEVEAAVRDAELERQKNALRGQQQLLQLVTAASILAVAMGITSWALSRQAQQAQKLAEQAQLRALNQSAQALFLSDQRFEALIAATQAGQLFQQLDAGQQTPALRAQVLSALQQALFWVQERNRLEGHTGMVWQIAFSPDNQKLASVSADGTMRLWGLDGAAQHVMESNGGPLLDLDFSPDGEYIVAVDADGNAYLWDSDGNRQNQWQAHTQPTRAVAFAPDGQAIATASEDVTVKIWDRQGNLLRTLPGEVGGLQALLWTQDNQIIAGDEQGGIYVWNPQGELLTSFTQQPGAITALDLSPNGETLVSVGLDRQVKLYSLDPPQEVRTFTAHEGSIYNVQFTPDGKQLITVGDDKVVRVWQLDGKPVATLVGPRGLIAALAINPTGDRIATSGGDQAVRLWELKRKNLHVLQGHTGMVNAVAIVPNQRHVITGGADTMLRVWDAFGNPLRSFQAHSQTINGLAVSPDGQEIASASADGTVRLWRSWMTNTTPVTVLTGHAGSVNGVAYHPDGDRLATVGEDHTLRLWRRDGTLLQTLDAHRDGAAGVSFSPDGQYLVSTGADYTARIWTVADMAKTPPRILAGHRGWVLDAQFSPDGSLVATGSYDNTAKIWRVSDGALLATLSGHEDGVLAVAFTPNGQHLFTASNDNSIRMWDLQGTLLATLSGHTQGVRDIALDPQGRFATSASSDGSVLIWERGGMDDLESLLQSSCQWLDNYLEHNQQVDPETQALCQSEPPSQSLTDAES